MVAKEKKTADAPTDAASAGELFAYVLGDKRVMEISSKIIFFLILFISPVVFANVSNDIPLENPIYNNINRLSNQGHIPDDIQSIRPITIDRLQQIYDRLVKIENLNKTATNDVLKIRNFLSLANKQNRLRYGLDTTYLHTNAQASPVLETAAFTNPLLNSKDEGRFEFQSTALRIQPRLSFDWDGWAAFEIQPALAVENSYVPGFNENRIFLQTAQLKLGHGDFEFSVGRSRVQLGNGILGGLTFGGSQTPLDMLQIRNSSPTVMPSFLKIFGPAQFVGFLAKLDTHQVFPGSLVVGERLVIKPHPVVELGFSQSVQLFGEGAPNLSAIDILSEIVGKRGQDINSVNLSNRNFSVDASVRIPAVWNAKIYAEMFFDDCCEFPLKRDSSKLVGMTLPQLFKSKGALTLEFIHTTEIYNRHGRYSSGFMNRGYTLGHPLGPDAEGYYLQYHHLIRDESEIDFVAAYEIRGDNELGLNGKDIRITTPSFEEAEKRFRSTIEWQKNWKGLNFWTSLETGYERVLSFDYITGQDRNNYLIRIENGFGF